MIMELLTPIPTLPGLLRRADTRWLPAISLNNQAIDKADTVTICPPAQHQQIADGHRLD